MVEGVEAQAVGSISIRIHSQYLKKFDDYYLNLNPIDHVENPWFREFWEDKFHCKFDKLPIETTTMSTTVEATTGFFAYENETDPSMVLPLKDNQQVPICTGGYLIHQNLVFYILIST